MTGRMSDNPADSLRRELIEALMRKRGSQVAGRRRSDADAILDRVMPLVSAALEAARADERANGLAEAAAIVEGLGQKFDAASDVLWEAAENVGWKVLPLAVSDGN